MLKQVLVLFFLIAGVLADAAYFALKYGGRGQEFIVEIRDDAKIQHARDLLSGETTDEPHIMGRIIKRSANYNPRYSYQIDPETIQFFNQAIEVCDASFEYTEDHLDEAGGAFLPGTYFCPWASFLVKEVNKFQFDNQDYQRTFRYVRKYWSDEKQDYCY